MTRHDPDETIRDWFHEGPDRGPSRGLEATLARLAQEPPRGRREVRMPAWLPLAAMLALLLAALLAFGAGFRITRPDPLALATPSVAPSASASTCRLEAPVGGIHGVLVGTGFAPDVDVTIDIQRADGTQITLDKAYSGAMHTDRRGGFAVAVRPYYADIGHEVAVAHAGCDARLELDVSAADLPPPCPDPADASSPAVNGPAYRAAVTADHPIDWWRFDDAGSTAVDSAGHDDGTYVGRALHAARSALSDGSSTFFDFRFPDDNSVDLARAVRLPGDFTIELWTYMCEYTDFALPILGFADRNVQLNSGTGTLHLQSGIADVAYADTPMPTGSWHHWALTRRDGALQFYLDGVADGWGAESHWLDPIEVVDIGRDAGGSTRGYYDEVALYDHALTPERVAAHARP
jgi:hypothetical protein